MAPTWLITGCSAGFGAALAQYVLSQGHNVIATSRNPSKNPDVVENIISKSNGRWVALDVTASEEQISKTITEASALFGGIDVLVNNAARSLLGATEDISERDSKAVFETNYWGPLKVIKSVLPQMRERRSGTIVNVSSIAGLTALPTASSYSGSKWALEALSEALSAELASFNVRVLTVEPGAFRTNFLTTDTTRYIPASEPYRGTVVDDVLRRFDGMNGNQAGDPEKGAARIFETVTGTGVGKGLKDGGYLRLLIGSDCWDRASRQAQKVRENIEACKECAASTGFEN